MRTLFPLNRRGLGQGRDGGHILFTTVLLLACVTALLIALLADERGILFLTRRLLNAEGTP